MQAIHREWPSTVGVLVSFTNLFTGALYRHLYRLPLPALPDSFTMGKRFWWPMPLFLDIYFLIHIKVQYWGWWGAHLQMTIKDEFFSIYFSNYEKLKLLLETLTSQNQILIFEEHLCKSNMGFYIWYWPGPNLKCTYSTSWTIVCITLATRSRPARL